MNGPLVVVGDALLDRDLEGRVERLCPDAPVPVVDDPSSTARPGGAALAAALAAADGVPVTLVTALGDDRPGRELAGLVAAAGVEMVDCGLDGSTPEKVRVRAAGRSLLRLDYGDRGGRIGALPRGGRTAIDTASAVLVADYGRGMTAQPGVREALAAAVRRQPCVWDPHPRGAPPVPGVRLATPNAAEAGVDAGGLATVIARARDLRERWDAAGVAVTLGARGALLVAGDGTPLAVPARSLTGPLDPCGAGDRFASRAAVALAGGALLSEAVTDAVAAATAFVADGGAAGALRPRREQTPGPAEVVARVRATGGTVVATGGCFDLLHAGHVQMLRAARALGDCLVVLLNSDASVRRLKGPGRPVVPQADRATVLSGLDCVDAVTIFDEDTPEAALDRLRPDVWAKGADYTVADLPEAALVASWGGQAVVVPYLAGRSTTRLIEEATRDLGT